jgi:hypothetical protein
MSGSIDPPCGDRKFVRMLVNRRALLVEEHLDYGLCHGVRTPPDAVDFVIAQVDPHRRRW